MAIVNAQAITGEEVGLRAGRIWALASGALGHLTLTHPLSHDVQILRP